MARLTRLGPARLGDVARAVFELWLARLQLDKRHMRAVVAAKPVEPISLHERQRILIKRVAFVIPRVAGRLPWRADCLVQALAAERWLQSKGIATTLTLGVQQNKPAAFEAHAWLSAGDIIVTGGDVSGYVPLARP